MHLERVRHASKSSVSALLSDGSIANVQLELGLVGIIRVCGLSFSLRDGVDGGWWLGEALVVTNGLYESVTEDQIRWTRLTCTGCVGCMGCIVAGNSEANDCEVD